MIFKKQNVKVLSDEKFIVILKKSILLELPEKYNIRQDSDGICIYNEIISPNNDWATYNLYFFPFSSILFIKYKKVMEELKKDIKEAQTN